MIDDKLRPIVSPSYWILGRMPYWTVICLSPTWTSSGNNTGALSTLWGRSIR